MFNEIFRQLVQPVSVVDTKYLVVSSNDFSREAGEI
jgi:hypothetical protein